MHRSLGLAVATLIAHPLTTACSGASSTVVKSSPTAAVIAIRDDVSDFEKWGTKNFTRPFLRIGYAEDIYFTESAAGPTRDRGSKPPAGTVSARDPRGLKRAFVAALGRALAEHSAVDVFLLAHSNHYVDWVAEIPAPLRRNLRLVYNTGCGDAEQGARWLELGAKAYVGHPGDNIAPIFYFYFLPEWVWGASLSDAVASSNRQTKDAIFTGPAGWVITLFALNGGEAARARDTGYYWSGTEARIFGDSDVRVDKM